MNLRDCVWEIQYQGMGKMEKIFGLELDERQK